VVVVILVVVFLFATVFPWPEPSAKRKATLIQCANNLRVIGLAYKLWSGDQTANYPMQVSVTNGGTMELANKGIAYVNFQAMSNELSTPKFLICPVDADPIVATNFTTDFNNSKISYFVGVDAVDEYPQRILSGDDNLEISGVSVNSGLLELPTNAPIIWTAERHKFVGNIGFADGGVIQVTTTNGLQKLLPQTGLATNRLAIL
jgi:hypothetical protein